MAIYSAVLDACYSAVLDACVLVPISLADTLLRTAEKQLIRPVWSERILTEVRAAILDIHPAIVIANLKDFPKDYLDEFDLEALSPDEFLLNQLDLAPRAVLSAVAEQARATCSPHLSAEEVLVSLEQAGAPNFADELLRRL